MNLNTHLKINANLCGVLASLGSGAAIVELKLIEEMAVDAFGLVHGGFIFGAADYAAMAAVNDPNVVLGGAEVRFLKPSKVGDIITFKAHVAESSGKRRKVEVFAFDSNGTEVFSGTFSCFVLERHALSSAKEPT